MRENAKLLVINLLAGIGTPPLSESGAEKACGLPPGTVAMWRREDIAFADELAAAFERGTDELEDRAVARGYAESDRLLERVLEARRPTRWKKDGLDTGAGNKPVSEMTIAELDAFIAEGKRQEALLARALDITPAPGAPVKE